VSDEIYRPTREVRKETASLEQLNGPVGIRKGVQCRNWAVDQNNIIGLLNKIPLDFGGTLGLTGPTSFKATRDGYCDPSLSELIRQFQQANGLGADGVVDPGGATYPLLRQFAAGKLPAKPRAGTFNEKKFTADLQAFLAAVNAFLRNHPGVLPPHLHLKIYTAKVQLEDLMGQHKIPQQPSAHAPARNLTAVEELGAILALGFILLAYTALPAVQKGIRNFCSIMYEGVKEVYYNVVHSVADAVRDMSLEAERVTAIYNSCKPEARNLRRIATEIYMLKDAPPARVPILLEMWLKSFAQLMRCLGDKGIALFEKLTQVWDLIQKVIGLFPKNRIGFIARFA
jgi:peptidoglycan hydrolase-like protein with peptidoglycan-binding domain